MRPPRLPLPPATPSCAASPFEHSRRSRNLLSFDDPLASRAPGCDSMAGWPAGSCLTGVVGEERDLDSIVQSELLEHARDVGLYGRDAHEEFAADLGVRFAERDCDADLAFAFGQSVNLFAGVASASVS